ncbi:MAG: hypothetical protein WD024_02560 [Bacillota bacterium]
MASPLFLEDSAQPAEELFSFAFSTFTFSTFSTFALFTFSTFTFRLAEFSHWQLALLIHEVLLT